MKHRFIAKRYWKDRSTAMGACDVLAKNFDDMIDLSLGDPDLITDERIIKSAFEDAKKGHTKYTDFRGDPELRRAICDLYREDYCMDVRDEEVFVCASGCLAMYLVMEAILDDGDEVILQAPYFTPYPQQIELARGVPVEMDSYENEDFQINISRLESLITERTKAVVINSPCNPTGSCLSVPTMEKLASVAEKHDLIIVSDDIYTAFSFQEPFVPFASLPGMKERTVTINSFSKNFTMTGWRVGNIIARDYIIRTIQQINENVVFTAPSISQRAALYAVRHRAEIQSSLAAEYKKRVHAAADRINAIPNMSVIYPPRGTFYLFVNIKATGLTSAEAADAILNEAHVLTLPGDAFGRSGEGYLRIACTCGVDKLNEAFDRISSMAVFRSTR